MKAEELRAAETFLYGTHRCTDQINNQVDSNDTGSGRSIKTIAEQNSGNTAQNRGNAGKDNDITIRTADAHSRQSREDNQA